MEMNFRNIAGFAAIVVISISFARLGWDLAIAAAAALIPTVTYLIGCLQWIIALALLLAIAALTIIMPLIVAALLIALLVALFAKMAEGIKDRIKKLQEHISTEARDAAIDATFLAVLGLYAGLVFFMGTDDFLKPFLHEATSDPSSIPSSPPEPARTIRVLALAAVGCSISKMLFLIPVRLVKVIAIIAPLTMLGTIASILYQASLARVDLSQFWNITKPIELFVLAIITCLLLLAIAYPFTPSGWRRIWRIENRKVAVTT
jgi:hypothetical protein